MILREILKEGRGAEKKRKKKRGIQENEEGDKRRIKEREDKGKDKEIH